MTHPLIQEIIDARQAHGLSMKDLAKLCGMPLSTIYRMERGKVSPTLTTLTRIKAKLDELTAQQQAGPETTEETAPIAA